MNSAVQPLLRAGPLPALLAVAALLLCTDVQARARILDHRPLPEPQAVAGAKPAPSSSPAPLLTSNAAASAPVQVPPAAPRTAEAALVMAALPEPPPATAPPAPAAPQADAPAAEHNVENRAATGVQLQVSSGLVWRSFSFEQDVYERMRTLHSSLVVYRFDAALYPSLNWVPLEGSIGFIAGYEGTLTGNVQDRDFGKEYPISHSELFGGVRVRRPVHQHELGFDVTVGRLHSGLDDGKADLAGVPDVSYTEIRSSLDFSVHFDRIRAGASAGFRVPLGYGEVGSADWFPRVGGYGLEGVLRGSYRLSPRASVEAATSLRRYVLEMNSEPEDAGEGRAEVAAGAVDAYWAGYVGVSFEL